MPTFELSEAVEAERNLDEVRVVDSPRLQTGVEAWREELGAYFAEMQTFESMDLVEIFMRLAAFSARASEMRNQASQSDNRRANAFRSQAIDPFLEACDFQFRVFSRIQSVREMEFKISGGGT